MRKGKGASDAESFQRRESSWQQKGGGGKPNSKRKYHSEPSLVKHNEKLWDKGGKSILMPMPIEQNVSVLKRISRTNIAWL